MPVIDVILNQYIDDFYRQGRVLPAPERVAQPLRRRKSFPPGIHVVPLGKEPGIAWRIHSPSRYKT